jgi:crotonobetainyl-CoA:carnitine CoA-transferase CaiB-like acyl-CoA transferase
VEGKLMEEPIFSKLKVLEFASVLAGPSVGQFFAELGAEVIKVENPQSAGDVTRSWKLPSEPTDESRSAYFCAANWGKKSLGLKLQDEGLDIARKLALQSDVIISSFKSGDGEKFGLDFESLCAHNPKLIYGHITGYGAKDFRTGYDALIQAESGFMSINGEPGTSGLKLPVALIDILAAHHLKECLLIGIIKRIQTGLGGYFPVSLFDVAVSSLANQATNFLHTRKVPVPMGSEHPNIVPYGSIFSTADQIKIILAIGSDTQFASLCRIIGREDLAQNPEYLNNANRVKNRIALQQILATETSKLKAGYILNACLKYYIPAGELRTIDKVFELDEVAGKLLKNTDHTLFGLPSLPTLYVMGSNIPHIAPPPAFAEHTHAILTEKLHFSIEKIQELRMAGIIV